MTTKSSLELSIKLFKHGCRVESDSAYIDGVLMEVLEEKKNKIHAYDLFWDFCVHNTDAFFHKCDHDLIIDTLFSMLIFDVRDEETKQDMEDYIWEQCKFNPNNE